MIYSTQRVLKKYILIGLMFLYLPQLWAQNWNPLYKYLDEKDQEVVDDAIKSIKKAGDIIQEANASYDQALILQSESESGGAPDPKRLKKLESEAVDQQIKADKIYAEAYESLYSVCANYLISLGTNVASGEEYKGKAREMMEQATSNRKKASKIRDPYEKATMLNEATGMENAAIDYLVISICLAHGDSTANALMAGGQIEDAEVQNKILFSVEQTISEMDARSNIEQIAVDADLIQKYGRYIADSTIPEPLVLNRSGVDGIDRFDVDLLRNYYQSYRTEIQPLAITGSDAEHTAAEALADALQHTDSANRDETISKSIDSESQVSMAQKTASKSKRSSKSDYTNAGKVKDINITRQTSDVLFSVQLAASRVPLTRAQLWAIYPGNLSVEVVVDKGWYKYRITGFRFYGEASMIASESGAKHAWVSATYQGSDISVQKAIEMTRVLEAEYKQNPNNTSSGDIDFYVQIAASRFRISDATFRDLCGSPSACREVIEEGWFKYQLYTGTNYKDALELRRSMSIKSFIVAYKGGTKMNLYKAIRTGK